MSNCPYFNTSSTSKKRMEIGAIKDPNVHTFFITRVLSNNTYVFTI